MERYDVTPTQNPFGFLWLANYVLYSVVCAFLLMKGWKKGNSIEERRRISASTRIRKSAQWYM